jgi:hypothetical protein
VPELQVGAQLRVDGDFSDLVAFAVYAQGAFAGRELYVVDVVGVQVIPWSEVLAFT